jgi:hypothetical protein
MALVLHKSLFFGDTQALSQEPDVITQLSPEDYFGSLVPCGTHPQLRQLDLHKSKRLYTIGRGEKNDCSIRDLYISAPHVQCCHVRAC